MKAENAEVKEDSAKTVVQLTDVTAVLDELKKLIYDTFIRLGCPQKALEDLLGLNVPININNFDRLPWSDRAKRANEQLNILHYVNLKVNPQRTCRCHLTLIYLSVCHTRAW